MSNQTNPYRTPQIADANHTAPASAPETFPWSALGFVVSMLSLMFLSCACGHLPWFALLATGPAMATAWLGFCLPRGDERYFRIENIAAAAVSTFVFLLNLCHVLWSGHGALLR